MELTWETLNENMELEPLVKPPVDRVQLVKYAGASGDFNPLHTVEEFARQAGLDGVIAHGMLSMGFLGQYLRHLLGVKGDILRMKVRFQRMVKPGDVLTCRGTVRTLRKDDRIAELEVAAVNQSGDIVTAGVAEVRFF
ncbi:MULTISPECIES: MaoC/PaaZ C-terminal domain-containing protein [Kyrpidia]|uniref:Dehydratase n=1 Tax=Kyrpidia spormannii TaxID=2055160 RepID=A0A6F9E4I9_9BACL|nr:MULTISPECIES: MaoC/PaaZ C-terminal domain-containing protein [Kyrpidia]MCL6577026.1 MaoC family dehydratase N-terminal domain-containing protein [Kyrpidia sp.]CAB3391210.1 Dehydratase [Kyrpidia spormannii]